MPHCALRLSLYLSFPASSFAGLRAITRLKQARSVSRFLFNRALSSSLDSSCTALLFTVLRVLPWFDWAHRISRSLSHRPPRFSLFHARRITVRRASCCNLSCAPRVITRLQLSRRVSRLLSDLILLFSSFPLSPSQRFSKSFYCFRLFHG